MKKAPVTVGFANVRCSGEAHSNPFIDHCGVCLPRWGEILVALKPEDAGRRVFLLDGVAYASRRDANKIAVDKGLTSYSVDTVTLRARSRRGDDAAL